MNLYSTFLIFPCNFFFTSKMRGDGLKSVCKLNLLFYKPFYQNLTFRRLTEPEGLLVSTFSSCLAEVMEWMGTTPLKQSWQDGMRFHSGSSIWVRLLPPSPFHIYPLRDDTAGHVVTEGDAGTAHTQFFSLVFCTLHELALQCHIARAMFCSSPPPPTTTLKEISNKQMEEQSIGIENGTPRKLGERGSGGMAMRVSGTGSVPTHTPHPLSSG